MKDEQFASNLNEWAARLAAAVKDLPFYLDPSSDCPHRERVEELASIIRSVEDIADEMRAEIDSAEYWADPWRSADEGEY